MSERPALPDDHAAYDAHLLRASIQGPQHELTVHYIQTRNLRSRNPWRVPWHMRPKVDATPFTIKDYSEDVRQRLIAAILRSLQTHPSTSIRERGLKDLRLPHHLAHTIVQHGVCLHSGNMRPDGLFAEIRRDLARIIHPHGAFCAETPIHPFWKDGKERKTGTGLPYRIGNRAPSEQDRALARYLRGPDAVINIEGPDGRIQDILQDAEPRLLALDDRHIIRYATELRTAIQKLLAGKDFNDACRSDVINRVADEWQKILPSDNKVILEQHVEDWDLPPQQFVEKHFPPDVIANTREFERLRPLLEERTILLAHAADRRERESMEEMDPIWDVWNRAMFRHKLALNDHPSLGVAFLAAHACYTTKEHFLQNIR